MTNKLARALGLIEASLSIKEMTEFNKDGLIRNLTEIKQILEEILNDK